MKSDLSLVKASSVLKLVVPLVIYFVFERMHKLGKNKMPCIRQKLRHQNTTMSMSTAKSVISLSAYLKLRLRPVCKVVDVHRMHIFLCVPVLKANTQSCSAKRMMILKSRPRTPRLQGASIPKFYKHALEP